MLTYGMLSMMSLCRDGPSLTLLPKHPRHNRTSEKWADSSGCPLPTPCILLYQPVLWNIQTCQKRDFVSASYLPERPGNQLCVVRQTG